jgi:hypothetical protein
MTSLSRSFRYSLINIKHGGTVAEPHYFNVAPAPGRKMMWPPLAPAATLSQCGVYCVYSAKLKNL